MLNIDTAAAKLATLTSGTLILNDVVRVEGVRRVEIVVASTGITLRVGRGNESYEHLPAGLTFRQIADHAFAVASGETVRPVGDLWTERRYSNLQGEGAARVWG
mgnify:CR=1 FL=1